MKFNKDDIYGITGSIAFHLAILLILWFTVLKTDIPDEEDGGVLVNFGNISAATGTFEPKNTGEVPQETTPSPPPPTPKVETPKEELVTQNVEESVAIAEAKKKKKEEARKKEEQVKREQERKQKEEAELKRIAEEKLKREQAIKNKVAGAFGAGSTGSGSQGDAASGEGNQGSPFGNSDHGDNEGIGGYGSFALNGRSIGASGLPRPAYTVQEEGLIVINITVDPKGNVIFSEIGKGTNIDNASMRKSALEAARRAKFNSITKSDNQSGTITYRYTLR